MLLRDYFRHILRAIWGNLGKGDFRSRRQRGRWVDKAREVGGQGEGGEGAKKATKEEDGLREGDFRGGGRRWKMRIWVKDADGGGDGGGGSEATSEGGGE
ncbi:hypothetical protein BOVATA_046260 [Babesia ovata]|uniref:Uncharacterized protein n=1 Tax=Babesia ovata TaxID=189622 RepID=A0A2H6KJF4_9APIC|nr:uncharacterized protein BOVATA_046260 [Babesia ovata]GBE63133.1 hypothetical protein BOVATA_046260 [Babesia ovata]